MKWKAAVRTVTGATIHRTAGSILPPAARIVIESDDPGWLLIRHDASGNFAGDTWHRSLDDAKRCARREFGVEDGDWELVDG